MMKRRLQRENGFSLIEVLASLVILSLLLTSFFTIFIQSAKTSKTSEEVVHATYTAQKMMEKLYIKK